MNNKRDHDSEEEDVFSDDAGASPGSAGKRSGMATGSVTVVGTVELPSMEMGAALYRLQVIGNRATQSFLLEEGEHTIGRSSDASIRVDEDSVSRKHVRLVIVDDRVTLTDLGSTYGTKVRERPIKARVPVDIAIGESFELGSVTCLLRRRKVAEKPRRKIYEHSYLETRVDEEIARRAAQRTMAADDGSGPTLRVHLGGGLTLCRVHIEGKLSDDVVEEVLEECLPKGALVAEYAPHELEILFLDLAWANVEESCDKLMSTLTARGATVRTGFALFPRDGRTASSLLSVANVKVQGPVFPDGAEPTTDVEDSGLQLRPSSTSAVPLQERGSMERLARLVERVAPSDISIIIHGETGVGKEVLARDIHRLSHRAGKTFVGLNCAALTETLLESELFGHERGAFSGAVNTKPGLFEVADKGTVFLDEIGEMSLSIQAKLLRVLEERTVLRVGGLSPRSIDVRFLAASHKDLEVEAADNRFRHDLYFRLNGITLEIPPLRDRPTEVEGLITTFVADVCRRSRRTDVPVVAKDAMAMLKGYRWPGNIRELRNIIERAVILCSGPRITAEHLPVERLQKRVPSSSSSPPAPLAPRPAGVVPRPGRVIAASPMEREEDSGTATRPTLRRPAFQAGQPADDHVPTLPPMRRPQGPPAGGESLKDAVSDLERERIVDALNVCGGNQTKAAEMLGISRRTLLNRLDVYNLPRPRK
ncbi:MAG: sigma 54-interacting transcriptional regulator [Deltaproteobacteria bacterium]|nr:sigma 54-interacting transcriptional regulator [Deltaproteobacteria bacterium]